MGKTKTKKRKSKTRKTYPYLLRPKNSLLADAEVLRGEIEEAAKRAIGIGMPSAHTLLVKAQLALKLEAAGHTDAASLIAKSLK